MSDAHQKGGGRNERKGNPDGQASAAEELEVAQAEFRELTAVPNKTPEDKERLKRLKGRIQHLRMKASERSEPHAIRAKGQ